MSFLRRWAQETHDLMLSLWQSPVAGDAGVSLQSSTRLGITEARPDEYAAVENTVFGLRHMGSRELAEYDRDGTQFK